MTQRALALLVLLCASCSRTLTGPTPAVQQVVNVANPALQPPQVCTAQGDPAHGWKVDLLGSGFGPLPAGVLTDKAQLRLPQVTLASVNVPASRIFFVDPSHLTIEVQTRDTTEPAGWPTGPADLAVQNPDGHATSNAAALTFVPPPTVNGVQVLTQGANASSDICADTAQQLVITGSGFRTGDVPQVQIGTHSFTPSVDSATQLTVQLPVGTFADATSAGLIATVNVLNPEGCVAPYGNDPRGLGITDVRIRSSCPRLGSLTVDPRYGWSQQNQPVTITNTFTAPATQGFTPGAAQAVLLAPLVGQTAPTRIPLRRVAFVDASTLSALVPTCTGLDPAATTCTAGIAPGGPYDIEVTDASGASGRVTAAFTVVNDPPPAVSILNPAAITVSGGTVTITGTNFDALGQHSTVLLGTQDPGGVKFCPVAVQGTPTATQIVVTVPASPGPNGCYVESSLGTRTPSATGFSLAEGLYLVRVQHAGDVSAVDYSGLVVTGSASNPVDKGVASSTLVTARGNAPATVATDDFGTPFLYVAGGSTANNTTTLLASVEVAPIGPFGDLGGVCTGAVCKFRELTRTPLPTARTGLSLLARTVPNDTSYLFAIGGRSSTGALTSVLRAQVLRNADAPVITSVTQPSGTGTLPKGTYTWRVSSVRPVTDTKNPGGETLASDFEPLTLSSDGRAQITWRCNGADKYRIYRTAGPDQPAGGEVLVQEVAASCGAGNLQSFTDDVQTTSTQAPLHAGSLGVWVDLKDATTPVQLAQKRFDAQARIVGDSIVVTGGCGNDAGCATTGDLASIERAVFPTTGTLETPGAFAGAGSFLNARSRHQLALANATNANITNGKAYLLAFGGVAAGAELTQAATVEVAEVPAPGTNLTWINLPSGARPNSLGAGGWAEMQANQAFFEVVSGGTLTSKSSYNCGNSATCTIAQASDFNFNFNSGFPTYLQGGQRYLVGEVLFRAYVYAAGGFASTTTSTPTNTVERIVY